MFNSNNTIQNILMTKMKINFEKYLIFQKLRRKCLPSYVTKNIKYN